ncbi:T9SS type A sorting domain-containing protein [Ekhidna sp.]|uniref:T9SS type A sorting domain-containing protein n=1 Tax=Ekhidna sp. TaxID=2608089 RepID=UPI003B5C72FB
MFDNVKACFIATLLCLFISTVAYSQDNCAARADFTWSEYAADDPILGDTHLDESVSFSFSTTGDGGITGDEINNNFPSGFFVYDETWEITQDLLNFTRSNTIIIDFNGDYLYDFCFQLYDIDSDGADFDDIVTVNGIDVSGNPITLAASDYTISSNNTQYNGNNEFEGIDEEFCCGFEPSNVTICFPEPIQRIEIVFENGDNTAGVQDFGIGDFDYCSQDFDNNGIKDDTETDADGDGILNTVEGYTPGDADGDGIPNVYDSDFPGRIDANGDNTDDNFDSDLDGAPDALDLDSDNDGILDAIENLPATGGFPEDSDGDGTDDYLDSDSDDDGVSDFIEGNDIDFNGVADISTLAGTDTDGDGIDDNLDVVDGIDTPGNLTGSAAVAAANLVDNDVIADFRDTDDDGDGVLTSAEIPDNNGDGIPDYISACEDGSVLNFDGFGLGTTPGPVFNIDAVNIEFDFTDPTNSNQAYEIDDGLQSENYVLIEQTTSAATAISLLRVKFDRPLEGFCFDLLEIDKISGNHVDSMNVSVFRDGDVIVLDGTNIITGASTQLNANNFVVGTANSNADEYLGNVRFCLLQSVDSMVIRYSNAIAPAGNQIIGLDDFSWCGIDSDYDEILDFDDPDDNNNGIADIIEGGGTDHSLDTDGDKIPDYLDTDLPGFTDSNGDGVNDLADLDLDGVPDQIDKDTDNDGIPDAVEANGGFLPSNMDEDGAYPPAYSLANDSDGDGIVNDVDTSTGGVALTNPDTDGDGYEDFRDLDSDNDGIADLVEAGGMDANGDGMIDGFSDATNDGFHDDYDPDVFGTTLLNGSITKRARNTDGGSFPDYIDIDSDNDGITDDVEAQTIAGYVGPSTNDTDGDGWDDSYDSDNGGTALVLIDTDSDSRADYRDTDSDGDGVRDAVESRDADSDGVADQLSSGTDSDNDGLDDSYDPDNGGSTSSNQDTDADAIVDFRDIDDDADGIPTESEDFNSNGNFADDFTQGGSPTPDYLYFTDDPDGDGIANASDLDDNNDGIPDADQSDVSDTDGDGITDRYDLDSDGDGIPNAFEANDGVLPSNMDENGQYPSAYASANDSDGDGLVDDIDDTGGAFTAGTALANADFDSDGLVDSQDADSDGDGIPDSIETVGADTNANGIPDSFTDTDGDGNLDYRDLDADGDGILDLREGQTTAGYIGSPSGTDTDSDGLDDSFDADNGGIALTGNDHDGDDTPDFQDSDSDADGISDLIEGNDNNADGIEDDTPSGTDADDNGVDDDFDASPVALQNTDGDSEADWRDSDDDGDGRPTIDESVDANPANGTPDYLESNGNTCGPGKVNNGTGYAVSVFEDVGATRQDAALGAPDYAGSGDNNTLLAYVDATGEYLSLDLGEVVAEGEDISIVTTSWNGQAAASMDVSSSLDGISFGNTVSFTGIVLRPSSETRTYTVPAEGIRYIRFTWVANTPYIDGVSFNSCADDSDNDGVQNDSDNDSDNDGIPDIDEGNGIDPTADADGDGLLNFEDSDIAGYEDVNTDGINDNFDQDLDSVPNHQDLDSDNDGIPDAVEANGGSLPANMTSEGAYLWSYITANDTDGDGLANDVDTDNGGVALANPDSDNGTGYDDNLPDFLDRDSDNDGITDAAENNGTDTNRDGALDGFVDTDGDGLNDSVDPDNGGSALSIINTDGDGSPDYLDTDSDGDSAGSPGLGDLFEGHDSNFDGTPSWDDDGDLTLDTNEGNIDLDGDGILDAFDPNQGGIGAALPNADGDSLPNFRDDDDDDDGTLTVAEDTNGDGNYFNDFTEGQSGEFANVPDYLYNSLSPLPVELISFKVLLEGSSAHLTWVTAQEINNDRFEIEHSNDGLSFKNVGEVKGNGTVNQVSEYSFIHRNLQSGFNYYRLKQVDYDGQFEYSEVKRVSLGAFEDVTVSIYPNPSSDVAHIVINEGIATSIELITLSGAVLKSIKYAEGMTKQTFNVTDLRSGMYLIRVQGPDVNTIKRLIVK